MEYDIKICSFWARFFPGFFKVGLPKKTRWVFLGTCPGVRTLAVLQTFGDSLHCHIRRLVNTKLNVKA